MRGSTIGFSMLLLLNVNELYAADDWTQQSPAYKPSALYYHAMAYIGGDRVLLFGGADASDRVDETWVYDLSANTWTQLSPASKPSARTYHAMAHIGGDRVLLFGGNDGSFDDETWIYDLSASIWTQQNPVSKPFARYSLGMAYIGGDQVLLFGGSDAGGPDDETWVYDLSANTWTLQNPASKPSEREQHGMAYIGGDQVLLFGGWDGSYYDETWVYDLSANTWTQRNPASKPSARYSNGMAYIGGDRVLLFGGYVGSYDDETWVYDLSDDEWTQDLNSAQPSARISHGMAESSMDGSSYPVLFGGYDGSVDDETWLFGGGDYLWLAPDIVSIGDVPNDQGREVAVLWRRSYLDIPSFEMIAYYSIWRKYPEPSAMNLSAEEWDGTVLRNDAQYVYRRTVGEDAQAGGRDDYWEFMGSVHAHFLDYYAYRAPTLEDSSGAGIPYFSYFVSAHTADPYVFYDSDPDSGYSVDNVNPVSTQLTIQFTGGPSTIFLDWDQVTLGVNESPELGSMSYRIYADTNPYFTPVPGNLLITTTLLNYDHTDSRIGDPAVNLFYVVIAKDGSDNESGGSNRVGEFDLSLP